MAYKEQLSEQFKVITAENGLQAVQMVYAQKSDYFQVILMDKNMPIMDGLTASTKI